ncbi:transcription initiation factor TFIID subunit 2 isoform X2 [Magnolia sinica]|uniref:transcription initiation factor TFIID subunit 2 isoform X2 n=1 Tax=Magnolia sinica TaxID=86752 RepID=UPI002659CC34|nr:transcription initiation factor TFIID subunit 2 isoform X2 [Magnolia sinica]
MAKPRKQKAEDQRAENSGAVVRHQKLCISVDMSNRRIYGYTELKVVVPESGRVGLHADNMTIDCISVDGEPADFEFLPHYQLVEDEQKWRSVSCTNSAADAACSSYISFLDKEVAPNLFISCCESVKSASDPQRQANGEDSSRYSCGDSKQAHTGNNGHAMHENVKSVRIDYWVDKAETGIHFKDNVLHTDNQIRRAHCWFPCIDSSLQRCCYDLEFTVDANLVAVSNGTLLYQVLSKDNPPRKTYVYRLSVPVTARWISLAVAPFEILPDRHNGILSHICLSSSISKLQNTVGFFYSTFSHYEDYLSTSFPFGSYKHVFITPEMAISPMSLGASMCIFSSQILFDEKVIDQTIDTRIKLAYALARQWFGVFITAEAPTDEWLLEGLAGFLTDSFVKRFLGNNEARYRRYKANCAVCKADVNGGTALSSSAASTDLYGTQCIGLYGKIRSWKAVAILQILEKQMGPESFCKILQAIISRAKNTTRSLRTLSTKEFRHFANKVGNLERPFLKEFFPRWVGSCGCPVLRMGFSYNKRRNMIELAVLRGCTAAADSTISESNGNPDKETREGDAGWPGMMSIRVHELDGMYDHPILPMAGETCQVLEIQCHSKLSAKRIQKHKKGSKPDGSDDNVDLAPTLDMRSSAESPLLWLRVDPEMEYLAEIQFHQPVQMWINQLEKDKDVVAQAQAIAILETLPHHSFSVVNALNNFLTDSKAFWRVRIEAALALAHTASEETDYAGLLHLIKFYKSRRFDATIGMPRPNDFHDFSEYFVLEAIPHAIAMVRATDQKSPRDAVEFVSELLKSIQLLSSLLKRIDRLLQFDRLMPSYNGILTISCIRALTQIALKFSASLALDRVFDLIKPFRNFETALWQVRIEASRALLDLEFNCKGIDEALSLFMIFIEEEPSLRGQVKLAVHMMHLCQIRSGSRAGDPINSSTLVALLCLLESRKSFNNVVLRHHLFCILQILAGRPPTLYGIPRIKVQPTIDVEHQAVNVEHPSVNAGHPAVNAEHPTVNADACSEPGSEPLEAEAKPAPLKLKLSKTQEPLVEAPPSNILPDYLPVPDPPKEADTVSNGSERRVAIVKIRVKPQPATSGRADNVDNAVDNSRGAHNETEVGPSSSVSVDAPPRVTNELVSTSHQNLEEANSHDHGSRMTASIGSAKFFNDDEAGKELQCTADSRKGGLADDQLWPSIKSINTGEAELQKYASVQSLSVGKRDDDGASLAKEDWKGKKEKKEKKREKKRKREGKAGEKSHQDDPEYLERKRLKKEKRQREKEMGKLKSGEQRVFSADLQNLARTVEPQVKATTSVGPRKLEETVESKMSMGGGETGLGATEATKGSSVHKLRIKLKSRTISNL